MKRIHIVGVSPRTGTTLMAEAIKNGFDIDIASEHEDRLFSRPPLKGNIFLTKCPKDIMIVGPSLRIDPHLYVICMLRDPRDIVCSKHNKDPEHYWASLRYWKTYSKQIKKLSDQPRFILVRYETFVSNPDAIQQLIMDRIPYLKKTCSFSTYHISASVSQSSSEALRGVRPITPKSVGKWSKHKERLAGQLQLHGSIAADLIEFGYEQDNSWLEELEGIEPDTLPGHFPEYMTWGKMFSLNLGKYAEAVRRLIEQMIGSQIRIRHPKKWFQRTGPGNDR